MEIQLLVIIIILVESLLNVGHPLKILGSVRSIDRGKPVPALMRVIVTRGYDIYCILNWLFRSSRLPTGTSSLETVRNAARLAV